MFGMDAMSGAIEGLKDMPQFKNLLLHAIIDFAFMDMMVTPVTIAFVHTSFNIISTIILFPVCSFIEKLAIKTIKGKKDEVNDEFSALDERFLNVGDVERISDHSVNICDVALEIHDKSIEFSQQAQKDIKVISTAVRDIVNLTIDALENEDLSLAKKVEPLEQVIDRLKRKIKAGHIERLKEGNCTVELGFVLSDLLTNYERVADHCSNIAVCLLEIANGSFDTHEYLSHVKNDGENDFALFYEAYKAKYPLN